MKSTVVDEGARRRGASTGVGCLVLLGLTLAALGHVALHTKHIEAGLKLGVASTLQKRLLEENRQLQSEIERLEDPARLVEVARDKLGMSRPAEIVSLAATASLFAPAEPVPAPRKAGKAKDKTP